VHKQHQVPTTPRGVIFDWGGVITTPIIDTVRAWLDADGIDRDSYTTAMRPWVRQAYGPDEAESPIHALERGDIADSEFERILAGTLVTVDGGPVRADGLLKRMFASLVMQPEMLDLVRELRASGRAAQADVRRVSDASRDARPDS